MKSFCHQVKGFVSLSHSKFIEEEGVDYSKKKYKDEIENGVAYKKVFSWIAATGHMQTAQKKNILSLNNRFRNKPTFMT